MFIPSGFAPSTAAFTPVLDPNDRVRATRIDGEDGALARVNDMYPTAAESPDAIAPFLAKNRAQDAKRRNYVVVDGGDIVFRTDPPPTVETVALPTAQESFGHFTQPGGNGSPRIMRRRGG